MGESTTVEMLTRANEIHNRKMRTLFFSIGVTGYDVYYVPLPFSNLGSDIWVEISS